MPFYSRIVWVPSALIVAPLYSQLGEPYQSSFPITGIVARRRQTRSLNAPHGGISQPPVLEYEPFASAQFVTLPACASLHYDWHLRSRPVFPAPQPVCQCMVDEVSTGVQG